MVQHSAQQLARLPGCRTRIEDADTPPQLSYAIRRDLRCAAHFTEPGRQRRMHHGPRREQVFAEITGFLPYAQRFISQ